MLPYFCQLPIELLRYFAFYVFFIFCYYCYLFSKYLPNNVLGPREYSINKTDTYPALVEIVDVGI